VAAVVIASATIATARSSAARTPSTFWPVAKGNGKLLV
jgi:hypothetical protein